MRRLLLIVPFISAALVSQVQTHSRASEAHNLLLGTDRAEARHVGPEYPHPTDDPTLEHVGVGISTAQDWSQSSDRTVCWSSGYGNANAMPGWRGHDQRSRVSGAAVRRRTPGSSERTCRTRRMRAGSRVRHNSFTPYYSYLKGSTIGSASSGIQETINAACGVDPISYKNGQCDVVIPANGPQVGLAHSINTYSVAGTIYLHANQSILSGYGASLDCKGRGACLQVGDLTSSNDYQSNTIQGLSFRSPTDFSRDPAYAGVAIVRTQRASQVVTITTARPHGFRVGDMVTIMFTDNNAFWGDAFVTATPSPTTFQYAHSGADIAPQTTPGDVALAYVAVLDNGMNTHMSDISYDKVGENGSFNNFFDFWDDENATITHFISTINLTGNANWTGSFVFSAGNQGPRHQIAPVITLRDSTITALNPGATVYNSNGLYVENTVLQSSGPWKFTRQIPLEIIRELTWRIFIPKAAMGPIRYLQRDLRLRAQASPV